MSATNAPVDTSAANEGTEAAASSSSELQNDSSSSPVGTAEKRTASVLSDCGTEVHVQKHSGKITFRNFDEYEGELVAEGSKEPDGKGTKKYIGGDVYTGDWVRGRRHGYGEMTHADGRVFKGYWEEDERCGEGTMTYPDGGVYVGSWKESLRWGKGKHTFPNGDVYEGDYFKAKWEGQGRFDWAYDGVEENGQFYVGGFHNDKFNGHGLMSMPNPENDQRRAAGKEELPPVIREGIFKDGEFVKRTNNFKKPQVCAIL